MSEVLHHFDFHLKEPEISEQQQQDLEAYFAIYEPLAEEISLRANEDLSHRPLFKNLIESIPEEIQKQNRKDSLRLQRNAILDGEWLPYLRYLMTQGITYAGMGMDFNAWHEVLQLVRGYLDPLFFKEYERNKENAISARNGMNLLFDIAMCVIGESFIYKRNQIIEQLQKEKEQLIISERDQRMYAIVDAANDGILLSDENGKILLINKAMNRLFGYSEKEIKGKSLTVTLPDRLRDFALDEFQKLIKAHASGKSAQKSIELTGKRKDGSEFPIDISYSTYSINDEVFFCGIVRDITQRKLDEQERNRTILLEEKNKELEQFTYVASHDLQEPLRTISSLSYFLKEQYGEKLDEQASKSIDYIHQASDNMKMLINDLLDYSRLGQERKLEKLDLNEIVKKAISNLNASVTNSGAIIDYQELPVIKAYRMEMKLLFQNLLSNAIKFTKKGTTPMVKIAATDKGDYWHFYVKDNGIGIDEKYFEKIFVMFKRGHKRSEYPGTGIGLANCKKVVEMHGGKIWVESASGNGSTFHFTIRKL